MGKKLKLILCWHMHQPHYKDGLDGTYRLPWVYLHALKDYTDMAAHLEQNPQARAVVNFAPVLLEQLEDYGSQLKNWLKTGVAPSDPLLSVAIGAISIPESVEEKYDLAVACQKAYAPTMIDPLPELKSLIDMVRLHQQHTQNPRGPEIDGQYHANELCINYLNDQFYIDLLMWYHLAWMGAVLREEDERIQQLMVQKHRFDASHQRLLAEVMADAISGVIPRYKALQDSGQIELAMSPYGHPIVPLLIDFKSTLEAMPDALLPQCPYYPEGYERAKWHLEYGVKVHERYFGQKPQGVWLSEGAVSTTAVGLLDEYDFKWTASGEGVWRHSVESSRLPMSDISSKRALYQPMQTSSQRCALFFRDDGLSDLIGFQYKSWAAEDAAANFVHNIENIARFLDGEVEERTVSVILDGENAWEYYPDNGRHFLEALYRHLSQSELVEMTTFSDALAQGAKVAHLPVLRAGSWVYGSFSTWIGDPEKNIAWDLLCEAKQTYDKVLAEGRLDKETRKKATEQLAICEGSDWFWWFGDYNPSDSVRDFDALYRRHLQRLYEILGETPPEILHTPISVGGGEMEQGGVMQRGI